MTEHLPWVPVEDWILAHPEPAWTRYYANGTIRSGPRPRLIPAGEAIPPCIDAGWTAPDLLIPWSELATYPNEDLRDLERVAATAGVEISNDQDRALRVHHRNPCVTTLPEPR